MMAPTPSWPPPDVADSANWTSANPEPWPNVTALQDAVKAIDRIKATQSHPAIEAVYLAPWLPEWVFVGVERNLFISQRLFDSIGIAGVFRGSGAIMLHTDTDYCRAKWDRMTATWCSSCAHREALQEAWSRDMCCPNCGKWMP